MSDGDGASRRPWLLAAAATAVPAAFAVVIPVMAAALSSAGAASLPTAPSGGALDPAHVPPAYVAAVTAAGAKCPTVTAPAIAAQLDAESGWNPNAVSPVGAQGIAQFMPGTWPGWGKDVNNDGSASPFDPLDAINAQGDYMCALAGDVAKDLQLGVVRGDPLDLALAAYNAGLGAVEQAGGIPAIPETQGYVARIRQLMTTYTAAGTGGAPLPGGASSVVDAAGKWLGYPYVWGGGGIEGPSGIGRDGRGPGFDCSGLVQYAVYHGVGLTLPRTADGQAWDSRGATIPRSWSQMKAGDVIGFSENGSGKRGSFGHIGIYLGGGRMLHAPQTGENVEIIDLQHSTYFAPMAWRIVRFSR